MAVDDMDKCKYFDLAQIVRERANADGAVVIILKGEESRVAPDLPPCLLPYLPEILQTCALQSAAFLRDRVERELRPAFEDAQNTTILSQAMRYSTSGKPS